MAGSLIDEYRDGFWFVELATVAEGELVPQLVSATLGVHEGPDKPHTTTLTEILQLWHLLLVLDICERVVDACAGLVEMLLSICPEIHILPTSREVLDVFGKVTGTIPPLSRLDIGTLGVVDNPDEMLKFDAIRLSAIVITQFP